MQQKSRSGERGIVVGSVPIGTDAFIDRELDKIAESCAELLHELKELEDPQVALLILRMSAAPRLTHLTRSMSLYSAPLVAHLIQHDARIADTLAQLLGLNGFSENQRAQKPAGALRLTSLQGLFCHQ